MTTYFEVRIIRNDFDLIRAQLDPIVSVVLEDAASRVELAVKFKVPSKRLKKTTSINRPEPMERQVVIGDKKRFWAHFTEYGTIKVPARPFMVPAVKEEQPRFEDQLVRRISDL